MTPTKIGIVHPGAMGARVAAAARAGGAAVYWASAGRSDASRARADDAGLRDASTLPALLAECDIVFSVCPPDAALAVANDAAAHGFAGTFVDANAIAPRTAREIGRIVRAAGAAFVDGGIVGPPPLRAGTTRLYLSGDDAGRVAARFAGSPLAAEVVDGGDGAASAVKMCYAAWTKGSAALLSAIRALARAEGVEAALLAEWALSQPGLAARSENDARQFAAKAWRFSGEMREIAASLGDAGLPAGFHEAAAEIYERQRAFKDCAEPPALEDLLARVLRPDSDG